MNILCSGSFVADIIVPNLPHIGPPGSLTYAPDGIKLSPGGHSSNVAIDLTQLGVQNIHAVGAVGRDDMGDLLIKQLCNRGVNPLAQIIQDNTTAKNVALLVKGEDRRYIAELTANSQLSAEFLSHALSETRPSIYYQGTLGGLPDIENHLSTILQETKKQQTLNLIDVIMPTRGWAYLKKAAPYIDILHANTLETENLTKTKYPEKYLKALNELGIKLAIISDAEKGVKASTINHRITMPSFNVEQRDPTGAGDALCAGIIKHIQTEKKIHEVLDDPEIIIEALLYGQAAGAACVTGIGATTRVTEETTNIILEQKETIRNKTVLEKL